MLPPSATLAVADSDTVVESTSSVTLVLAAAGSICSDSKLPPVAVAIVALTVEASRYGSSPGAATVTEPVVAPAAIAIVAPLDSVTLTAVCAAFVNVAV